VFIAKFGKFFPRLNWVNFGGGHHITRKDYNRTELKKTLREFSEKYNLQVYLEPGEAIALNAGVLVSTVLETVKNRITTAILDTSAACHMPDVIEMPYTPNAVLFHNGNFYDGVVIKSEKDVSEKTVRLAGNTCLAGDRIGDYEFETAVSIGDKIIFGDMAIYTTVKNNTFNGTPLPAVVVLRKNGETETLNSFGYEDFKRRL
jgi:carboxynorspermidine decarboxylase